MVMQSINPTDRKWIEIVEALNLKGPDKMIALHCVPIAFDRALKQLVVIIDSRMKGIRTVKREEALTRALSEYFEIPITLEIRNGIPPIRTPAQAAEYEVGLMAMAEFSKHRIH